MPAVPCRQNPIIGIRGDSGTVRAQIIPNTKVRTLQAFIRENAPEGAVVVTDQHAGYVGIAAHGYQHISVNHSVGEYVREMAHTNGIESFWAMLKRGHYGIFYFMSAKHLHRYVNEFPFRQNTAQDGTMRFTEKTIARMVGKRLTYKSLSRVDKRDSQKAHALSQDCFLRSSHGSRGFVGRGVGVDRAAAAA